MASQRLHFFADRQGLWLFADANWQDLAAASPDEALGNGWLAQVCAADRERVAAAWQKAVRNCEPCSFNYTLLNGVQVSHHASPTPQGFVGSLDSGTLPESQTKTAQKQAELALAESETRLLRLAQNLPGAVLQYCWHPDGRDSMVYVSEGCEHLWGLTSAQIGSNTEQLWQAVHIDDREGIRHSLACSAADLSLWQHSWRITTTGGQLKWVEASGMPRRLADGAVLWDAVILDVSQRRQLEEELQASVSRFEQLNRNVPAVVYRFVTEPATQAEVIYISDRASELFDLPLAQCWDIHAIWNLIEPYDRDQLEMTRQNAQPLCQSWQLSIQITTPKGRRKWLEISAQPSALADGRYLCDGVILDITDRKQAELALQAAQQHFQTLAENSPDIIERFDRDLRHLYVSPALEHLTGIAAAAFLGKTCRELDMDPAMVAAFEAAANQALTTAAPQRIEFETPTRMGHCTFEMVIVPELALNPATDQSEVVSLLCISRNVTRYREALRALQASESRLATLIGNLPGFVYTFLHTPDYPATYLSKGVEAITGHSVNQFISQTLHFGQIMHPDDREFVWQAINNATATHSPYEFEYRIIAATGAIRWVWERGQGIFDDRDQLLYTEGFVTDITARKQAELELQAKIQREQALNRVTQAIRDSLDLPTIFTTATHDIAELFQLHLATVARYEPDQSIWRHICDSYSDPGVTQFSGYTIPDDDNPFAAALKRGEIVNVSTQSITDPVNQGVAQAFPGTWLLLPLVVEGQTWGSLTLKIADLNYTWSADQIDLAQMLANQLAIAIQQAQLAAQLKGANQHLQQQVDVRTQDLQKALEFEALTRRITNQISVSFDEIEILGTAVEAIGQSLQPLLCNISTYVDRQPKVRYTYRHGLCEGGNALLPVEQHLDIYSNLYGGQTTHATTYVESLHQQVTLLAVPIRQESRTIGDILVVRSAETHFSPAEIDLVTQVSDQCTIALRQSRLYQAAQSQVEELQRLNQLKDDFLSTISHELRTPMTSIKMATQMLNLHLGNLSDLPESIWRYVDVLKSESNREIALINDLLEMTRLEAGAADLSLSPVDLGQLIQRLITPLSLRLQEQHQNFQMTIPDDLPIIYSDVNYLERILSELLFNASKYTPAHEHIRVNAALKAGQLAIEVTNTGVSIPQSEWQHIFDKFYRLSQNDPWKHGGTGLGLALVQQCAATLGGRITVSSTATSTTFTVELPASLTAATDAKR